MRAYAAESLVEQLVAAVAQPAAARTAALAVTENPARDPSSSRATRWLRAAVRAWEPEPVPGHLALAVLGHADELCRRHTERLGGDVPISVALARPQGDSSLTDGIFVAGSMPHPVAPWSREDARRAFLQNAFGEAPAALFFHVDLYRGLGSRGAAGLRDATLACGAAAAGAWLRIAELRLGGCMSAGVMGHPLVERLGSDDLTTAVIVSLIFGIPRAEAPTQ